MSRPTSTRDLRPSELALVKLLLGRFERLRMSLDPWPRRLE